MPASLIKIASVGPGVTSYVDDGLTPLQNYSYTVVATNLVGTIHSDFAALTMPDDAAPITPAHFLAASSSLGAINLVWRGVPGATGYTIERTTTSVQAGQTVSTVFTQTIASGMVTSYVDTGLIPGQSYSYQITAVNAQGSSTASSAINAVAPDANFMPPGALDPSFAPSPPLTGISALAIAPSGSIFYQQTSSSFFPYVLEESAATGAQVGSFAPYIAGGNIIGIVPLANGEILTALSYEQTNFSYVYLLRIFNATGAQDTTVTLPTFTGEIDSLTALPDGKILVMGEFSAVNGLTADGPGAAQCRWLAGHVILDHGVAGSRCLVPWRRGTAE